jgi:hypothetical protein
MTDNPKVIGSSTGFVPRDALVFTNIASTLKKVYSECVSE